MIFKGFLKHGFSAFHPVFYDLNNSTPPASTKKSLLEPLSKSRASGEDFFHCFVKLSFPLIV